VRVLFVHEVSFLDKPIFEMHEFPEYLASRGHEVHFVDFLENGHLFSKIGISTRAITGRTSSVGLTLHSVSAPFWGIVKRVLAALGAPGFLGRTINQVAPDVIVTYAVPTFGWQTVRLARRRGIPVVYRALDVSHRLRKTLFSKLVRRAESYVCKNATHISANNSALESYCLRLAGGTLSSSVDLPPLDLELFHPTASSSSKAGEPEARATVIFLGTFFPFSGLDVFIESMSRLDDINFKLVLIGGGELDQKLRSLTAELQLDEFVEFLGFVEYSSLIKHLQSADIAINPMVPSLVAHKALPNKILQYMGSGLPVVSTRLEGLQSVIQDSAGLFLVSNPGQLAAEVSDLVRNLDKLATLGLEARKSVEGLFGNHSPEEEFQQLLLNLADVAT